MKVLIVLAFAVLAYPANRQDWLARVSSIITPAERAAYLSLAPDARPQFEKNFWNAKPITEQEFFERLAYIDNAFGSGKEGSGLNVDQGRVYLTLGAPNRITRVPSSRSFFPIEIWYYNVAPALQITSELRLLFYLKNGLGFYQLYSPTIDTIRALLTPQAGTSGLFGPNDSISLSTMQAQLSSLPTENEILEAAISVSPGITNEGNEEILSRAVSPRAAFSNRPLRPEVRSKLLLAQQKLSTETIASPYGGIQAGLIFDTTVSHRLRVEVKQNTIPIYQSELTFHFEGARPIRYLHRLDLLPGRYIVSFVVDGMTFPYPLEIPEAPVTGEIVRDGDTTRLAMSAAQPVTWSIRRGMSVLWKQEAPSANPSIVDLPVTTLPPGSYRLEAATAGGETRSIDLQLTEQRDPDRRTIVSYKANLSAGQRLAFIGQQWLVRGKWERARESLNASLSAMPSGNDQAWIALSRLDALSGRYDDARQKLRPLVDAQPTNFEALSVLAYVEAKLQDYPVAAVLYRRALALEDSPALRLALAQLPSQ
jgi:GWxTD domain-containing protein